MKGKSIKDFFNRKKIVASTCAVLSAALLIGGVAVVQDAINTIELASYVDPVLETSIEEEETPLASSPKVTTTSKTSTKTTTKNEWMKTASTKSYTKTLPTTSKTTTKTTKKNSTTTVKTQTTVKTAVTEKYTKKSKKKVTTTKVTTTVKTTTTVQASQSASGTKKAAYEVDVTKLAPKMDSKVISAFQTLGCKIVIDSSVNYSGYFDASSKQITLKKEDDTIYHELGHFLAFVAGNVDETSSWIAIYNAEKSKYTGVNKAYVTSSKNEYFAESVRDYILNKAALKSARPKTYAAIEQALSKVTTAQVARMKLLLSF
jgi:hypothetical protein